MTRICKKIICDVIRQKWRLDTLQILYSILVMNNIVLRRKSSFIIQLRWSKKHGKLEFISAVGETSSEKFQNRKSGSGTLIRPITGGFRNYNSGSITDKHVTIWLSERLQIRPSFVLAELDRRERVRFLHKLFLLL